MVTRRAARTPRTAAVLATIAAAVTLAPAAAAPNDAAPAWWGVLCGEADGPACRRWRAAADPAATNSRSAGLDEGGACLVRALSIASPADGAVGLATEAAHLRAAVPGCPGAPIHWSAPATGHLGTQRDAAGLRLVLPPGMHDLEARWCPGAGAPCLRRTTRMWARPPPSHALPTLSELGRLLAEGARGLVPWSTAARVLAPLRMLGGIAGGPQALITNQNAAVGNGRTTVGFSATGDVSLLRWPSPGLPDHVDYLAYNGSLPRKGAPETAGVFAGLRVRGAGPALDGVHWLRDMAPVSQRYDGEDSNVLVTRFHHRGLGLHVTQRDLVPPRGAGSAEAADVWMQELRVEATGTGAAARAAARGRPLSLSLVRFANLAPSTYRIPYLPVTDWVLDFWNDFAAFFRSDGDGDGDALFHFRPRAANGDNAPYAAALAAGGDADALAAVADDPRFADGAHFAQGVVTPGARTGRPRRAACSPVPASGRLADFRPGAATCLGACACQWEEPVAQGDPLVFVTGAGATRREAARALTAGKRLGFPAAAAAAASHWRAFLASLRLPGPAASDAVRQVCKRGFLALGVATANVSEARALGARVFGAHDEAAPPLSPPTEARDMLAIVASVASQPEYSADWPRDGAFINLALLRAGRADMARAHDRFYAAVMRRQGLLTPGGTFAMNFWADGMPGGPVPLEIDEAGLMPWNMMNHWRIANESRAKREAHLRDVYPAIRAVADFAALYADPVTGLPLPANEDDHPLPTQGIQGSTALLSGLSSAIEAGRIVGEDPARVRQWRARWTRLRDAVLNRFRDPGAPTWGLHGPHRCVRGAAWFLYPAQVVPVDSPEAMHQADALWNASAAALVARRPGRYAYVSEQAHAIMRPWLAAARAAPESAAAQTHTRKLKELLRVLARDVPTAGTQHYSEWYRVQPGGQVDPINDVPHVWEHMLTYLVTMELEDAGKHV